EREVRLARAAGNSRIMPETCLLRTKYVSCPFHLPSLVLSRGSIDFLTYPAGERPLEFGLHRCAVRKPDESKCSGSDRFLLGVARTLDLVIIHLAKASTCIRPKRSKHPAERNALQTPYNNNRI
ncbi:unnamed protein product, partial [Ectocarpus sp. 8 AP-2014]